MGHHFLHAKRRRTCGQLGTYSDEAATVSKSRVITAHWPARHLCSAVPFGPQQPAGARTSIQDQLQDTTRCTRPRRVKCVHKLGQAQVLLKGHETHRGAGNTTQHGQIGSHQRSTLAMQTTKRWVHGSKPRNSKHQGTASRQAMPWDTWHDVRQCPPRGPLDRAPFASLGPGWRPKRVNPFWPFCVFWARQAATHQPSQVAASRSFNRVPCGV